MHENDRAAAVAERVVNEVFLSPRVVDSATLAEFADSLGQLLRRAAEQREHLRRTVAEGESVAATLRDTTGQATEKLRPAAKLLPAIDQKLAQAEQAMTRAAEAAQQAEAAAGHAAEAAAAEGAAALRAAGAALAEALEKSRQLESRLGQLTERAEQAIASLDRECRERLETASRHAQDVLGTTAAELDARAEQTLGRLTALIEDRRAAAEAALAEPLAVGRVGGSDDGATDPSDAWDGQASAGVHAEVDQARAELDALLDAARSRAHDQIASLEALAESAERRAAEAGGRAAEAAGRAEQTEALALAAEERLASVRRELAAVDERGREIAGMASQALAAFDEELTGRMHAVREMMEQLATLAADRSIPQATPPPAGATPPTHEAEIKPQREVTFVRIDRPLHGESPGLPGHLRI